jgi:Spy/CpxP family protein refolding chaperone
MTRLIALAALLLWAGSAAAQTPYAGLQARPVKALSEQQIADLRNGRGMGLALAAELNGYPGPVHVLELADKLALTPEQRARMTTIYEAMKAEAVPLGERLIIEEGNLDRLFAERTVNAANLSAATAAIGQIQAALRLAHLKYHLATIEVLEPQQIHRYSELRGYGKPGHDTRHHRPHQR